MFKCLILEAFACYCRQAYFQSQLSSFVFPGLGYFTLRRVRRMARVADHSLTTNADHSLIPKPLYLKPFILKDLLNTGTMVLKEVELSVNSHSNI